MACAPNLARLLRLWLRLLLAAGLALHGAAAAAGPDGGGVRPAEGARWGDAAALPVLGAPRPGLRFAGKAANAGPDGVQAHPPALPPRPAVRPVLPGAATGGAPAARPVHLPAPAARAPPGLPPPA